MKLFNSGLALMVFAVIALPTTTVINAGNQKFVLYGFYFCAFLELIGVIFVLVHIIKLKRK